MERIAVFGRAAAALRIPGAAQVEFPLSDLDLSVPELAVGRIYVCARKGTFDRVVLADAALAAFAPELAQELRIPVAASGADGGLTWSDPAPLRFRTVGILGGLGPMATADLLHKIIEHTPARCDQDHLHVIVEDNPGVPDRYSYLNGTSTAYPGIGMLAAALRLRDAGAEFLLMPCNTAHTMIPWLEPEAGIPFLSIISATTGWIRCRYGSSVRRIGILGTTGTIRSRIYHDELEKAGYQAIEPATDDEQELVQRAIYEPDGIKAGKITGPRRSLRRAALRMIDRGAEMIILGCTEIPLVLRQIDLPVPAIDATDALARSAVMVATGTMKLEQNHDEK